MREIDPLITSFIHLNEKPREAEALKTLQRVASLVKPLMRQRGWHVGTLAEFFPPEPNLLGVNWNKGQQICLRLRYPGDERQFLPLEQVVDTMLHELSHNVHGPHNAEFHALWQQLRREHEELASKGYTGEGFLSPGHKLGGRRIPMDEARRQARAAAEQRRVLGAGSGQRLGGKRVRAGADMRKVIADAALSRTNITKGCASGAKDTQRIVERATRNGFRTQADEDDANERAIMEAYIELLQEEEKQKWGDAYVPASAQNPGGSGASGDSAGNPVLLDEPVAVSPNRPRSRPSTSTPAPAAAPAAAAALTPARTISDSTWTCPICTLDNRFEYLCCDACGVERPASVSPKIGSAGGASTKTGSGAKDGTNRPRAAHRAAKGESAISRPSSTATTATATAAPPPYWVCHVCDAVMEAQWWTCATCGTMKLSS